MNDYLVTDIYIENMIEEINEDLQQKSQMTLAEICQKFNFPKDYI